MTTPDDMTNRALYNLSRETGEFANQHRIVRNVAFVGGVVCEALAGVMAVKGIDRHLMFTFAGLGATSFMFCGIAESMRRESTRVSTKIGAQLNDLMTLDAIHSEAELWPEIVENLKASD